MGLALRVDVDGSLAVNGIGRFGNGPERVERIKQGPGWVISPVEDLDEKYPSLAGADFGSLGDDGRGWVVDVDGRLVVYMDGETATSIALPRLAEHKGAFVRKYGVAPDGSLWVVVMVDETDDDRVVPDGLYVITPEAVAAAE